MKKLNLRLQGGMTLKPIVKLDGKVVPYRKNKYEAIELTHETENDSVMLEVENILEIKGPCWWFVQMAFFIISLFGILNPRLAKSHFLVTYKAKINLADGENNVALKFNLPQDKQKAISPLKEANIEEIANEYTEDLVAKKRKKWLKISYLISWILLVMAIILVLVIR